MAELLTAAQMRAIERAAIESGEVTGLELMERAGRGVVEAIMDEWPELAQSSYKAVVLCGPGNNGGDGFVVARLLKQNGWEVEVFLYGDPDKLPPDAKVNYERWGALGEVQDAREILSDGDLYELLEDLPMLFVDALFGTGLSRPLEMQSYGRKDLGEDPTELYPSALSFWLEVPKFVDEESGKRIRSISVDMPSGYCSDSGKDMQGFEKIDLCVSFQTPKIGHIVGAVPDCLKSLRIVDIGLPRDSAGRVAFPRAGMRYADIVWANSVTGYSLSKRLMQDSHKYTHGHALILSGPSGKTGAARLAARAALRVGAGLVTLGVPHEAVTEVAAQITAVMLTEIDTGAALAEVLKDDRINALCLGPGLGLDERAVGIVASALDCALGSTIDREAPDQVRGARDNHVMRDPVPVLTRDLGDLGGAQAGRAPGSSPGRAIVLDADALTILAREPDLFAALPENCVLTPHAGEFKRLFPDLAAKLAEPPTKGPAYSKVDATREAAKRAGCTVLFKGPDTVIASPDGRCSVNAAVYERAAPWLATAGSGDVLAGLIAGLMARGFAPHHAAETAAWLHVEAARSFGPGLIAEDLPEELPKVFRALGM